MTNRKGERRRRKRQGNNDISLFTVLLSPPRLEMNILMGSSVY